MDFKEFKIDQKGFTLVELLVSMGIFILIIGGITGLMLFSFKSNKIIWEQLLTQSEGRKVTQDFSAKLRTATHSSLGGYPISAASSTAIVFYTNIDSDSLMERVRYYLDGTSLKKGVIKPTGSPLVYDTSAETAVIVAHDIANTAGQPVFVYYGENYTGSESPLTAPIDTSLIRLVKFSLEMEEDPFASPLPFHIESKVEIRNLKSN